MNKKGKEFQIRIFILFIRKTVKQFIMLPEEQCDYKLKTQNIYANGKSGMLPTEFQKFKLDLKGLN